MGEVWVRVPGYEDSYEVSDAGRVRSIDRYRPTKGGAMQLRKGRILKQTVNRYGYLYVSLSDNSKHRNVSVHRIVMSAFKGDSPLTVNHINENKLDNRLENLEYMTAKENLTFGTGIERRAEGVKRRRIPVESYDLETGETVQRFDGVNDTARYGYTPQTVSHCCNGRIKSHRGLGWRRQESK